jgi:hypothetical protein
MPRYLRDERFVCVYDRVRNTVEKIGPAFGKPRGYPPDARFSWKGSRAVYKIWNAHEAENTENPLMLIDMGSLKQAEITRAGEKPELSPDGSRIAFIRNNELWLYDIGKKTSARVLQPGGIQLIFTMWDRPDGIDVHCRAGGKFAVYSFNPATGSFTKTGKPYLRNFGNHSTSDVLKSLPSSSPR